MMKDGYVIKNNSDVKITEEEMEQINKFTKRKLKQDEVYVFSVVLCDNDIDREFERFSDNALGGLSQMFVGTTGILDHEAKSKNQTARIFSCYVEGVLGKLNEAGEPYKRLVAKAYMPKSPKNEQIILEIDSGIKKEVSVGCAIGSKTCSICDNNTKIKVCEHVKGKKYKKSGLFRTCHVVLDNPTDAYEWSFVAIPAQRKAGVIKAFSGKNNKEDFKMEDVIKKLSLGKAFSVSDEECVKIFELISDLKTKANFGEVYKTALQKEVLKLTGLVEPEINAEIAKSVTLRMSLEELKAYREFYKKKLAKIIPVKPQLSEIKPELKFAQNTQFKI